MPNVSMSNFMTLVHGAHNGFRQSASSLNNIIILLGGNENGSPNIRNINNLTARNIESEIHKLPLAKLQRYQAPLELLGVALDIDSFARPTNYSMAYSGFELRWVEYNDVNLGLTRIDNASYFFKHQLSFESTNGDNATFNHCLSREHIWYPNARAFAPPFNQLLNGVPQTFFMPENGSIGPGVQDDHSTFNPN